MIPAQMYVDSKNAGTETLTKDGDVYTATVTPVIPAPQPVVYRQTIVEVDGAISQQQATIASYQTAIDACNATITNLNVIKADMEAIS